MKNVINEKRVFIGTPISTIINPVLSVLKSKFIQYSENIKWISSEYIHLTLKFLGNTSVNDLPILIQSLKKNSL
tara:strand:+ start:239 stop:460 length:222 start_codon:yes stop_codon:yes gene_type:complete